MKLCLNCKRVLQSDGWLCRVCGWSPMVENGFVIFAPDLFREFDGFSPDFFATLAELEDRHFWFKARNRLLGWALGRYFPNINSFCEVGCGTGFVLSGIRDAFPSLVLFGCDALLGGLQFARSRLPSVTLFQSDARRIPFQEEFDVMGAFDVIEHIEEDEDVLTQLFTATKTGGGIILTVPQHPFLWSMADEYGFHKRRYTRPQLVAKIQQAGFRIVMVTSFVMFLLPLMLLSRLRYNNFVGDYDPLHELAIGEFPNFILEQIMVFESFFLQRGVSLPIGGSLLVVAEKTTANRGCGCRSS